MDGVTTTIRNHLKARHSAEYNKIVHTLKLKHSNDSEVPSFALTTPSRSRAHKFDLNTWHQLLIKWIVTDDQVRIIILFEINVSNPVLRPLVWWIILDSVHGLFMAATTLLKMIYRIEQNWLK